MRPVEPLRSLRGGRGRRLLALALLLAVPCPSETAAMERRFERHSATAGLDGLAVFDLAQDADGFLWVASAEGLHRFDGYGSEVFRRGPDPVADLHSGRVSSLLLTAEGTLWVGTRGGGLSRFDADTRTFTTFRHDPDDPTSLAADDVMDLAADGRGGIWVATARGGVDLIEDPGAGAIAFRHHRHDPGDPSSLPDDRTRQLHLDRSGRLWVATMSGLARADDGGVGGSFRRYRHDPSRPDSLPDDEVWSVTEDGDGAIWVGMWGGGLSRLTDLGAPAAEAPFTTFQSIPGDPRTLSDNRVMEILEDRDGTLWIGTLGGLNELTAAERARPAPRFRRHLHDAGWDRSVGSDDIEALLEDASGDVWIGHSDGLDRLDRRFREIESHRHRAEGEEGLSSYPHGALVDRNGVLWVTNGRGFDRVERSSDPLVPARVRTTRFDPEDNGVEAGAAFALLEDRFGIVWMATFDGLVGVHPDQQDAERPRLLHYLDGLSSDAVLSLHEDAAGSFWLGTYRGLHRVVRNEEGLPVSFPLVSGAPEEGKVFGSVDSLTTDAGGTLWVGTYAGLFEVDPSSGRAVVHRPDLRHPESLRHEFVQTLHVDDRDRLWVGTRAGGVARHLGADRFQSLGVVDGLPTDDVDSVMSWSGALWLGTPRGLVRLDPDSLATDTLGVADGLSDREIVLLGRHDDGLLVVTETAVDLLGPSFGRHDPGSRPVSFTGLRILNRPVAIGAPVLPRSLERMDEIVLSHTDYLVAFEFASPDPRRASTVAYRYRLEGLDEAWIETGAAERRASYSTLPPGSYTLRVQAGGDGTFDRPSETSLRVTVLPPWWRTLWVRILGLLLLVVGIAAVPLVRLARARRHSERLETEVAERTADLAAANRRLEELATTDATTGLPNRRRFMESVTVAEAAARRHRRPLAVAIADLDHFKRVNDTWGHVAGDEVLREVARRMRASIRTEDQVARWGGEEFLFLFPDTDLDGALQVAETVRRALAAEPVAWNGHAIDVTTTIGVALVEEGAGFQAAVAGADEAMYRGKQGGRNTVEPQTAPAGD